MDKINEDILIAAKNGKLKAFDELVLFYQDAIYNHLFRLSKDADDAADLTQATFIKLYKTRDRIREMENFNSYLYKIATNTAYDFFKNKSRHPVDLIIDDNEGNYFETIEAERSYYNTEGINKTDIDKIDLNIALDKIKLANKNLLLLYYQEGLSYEEISGILNKPLNTVKTLLRRAKEELLKKFN